MKQVILNVAMIALLLGCSATEGSEAKGSVTDEFAKTCVEDEGELLSHTLVKAADGSISGKVKIKSDQEIATYECTYDEGNWGSLLVSLVDKSGKELMSSTSVENFSPVDQIMKDYPGYELVHGGLEGQDDKMSGNITILSPEGEEKSLTCEVQLAADGAIDNYTCK